VDAAMTYFTQQVEGGHSMALVGYDDQHRVFIVRNSFGTDWGDQGYGYLSYDFFDARRFNPLRAPGWWVGQVVGVGGVELGVE
jgi:C1A family cysteine protease